VTQKQLMMVAGALPTTWKEVGIRLLDIKREKLDQRAHAEDASVQHAVLLALHPEGAGHGGPAVRPPQR